MFLLYGIEKKNKSLSLMIKIWKIKAVDLNEGEKYQRDLPGSFENATREANRISFLESFVKLVPVLGLLAISIATLESSF